MKTKTLLSIVLIIATFNVCNLKAANRVIHHSREQINIEPPKLTDSLFSYSITYKTGEHYFTNNRSNITYSFPHTFAKSFLQIVPLCYIQYLDSAKNLIDTIAPIYFIQNYTLQRKCDIYNQNNELIETIIDTIQAKKKDVKMAYKASESYNYRTKYKIQVYDINNKLKHTHYTEYPLNGYTVIAEYNQIIQYPSTYKITCESFRTSDIRITHLDIKGKIYPKEYSTKETAQILKQDTTYCLGVLINKKEKPIIKYNKETKILSYNKYYTHYGVNGIKQIDNIIKCIILDYVPQLVNVYKNKPSYNFRIYGKYDTYLENMIPIKDYRMWK